MALNIYIVRNGKVVRDPHGESIARLIYGKPVRKRAKPHMRGERDAALNRLRLRKKKKDTPTK